MSCMKSYIDSRLPNEQIVDSIDMVDIGRECLVLNLFEEFISISEMGNTIQINYELPISLCISLVIYPVGRLGQHEHNPKEFN